MTVRRKPSGRIMLGLLADGIPRSLRQIQLDTGLPYKAVESTLWRLNRDGRVLRSVHPFRQSQVQFKGRGGSVRNLRSYFLYALRPVGVDELELNGLVFSASQPRPPGQTTPSKSARIRSYLEDHKGAAYFSRELVDHLGVNPSDIMSCIRRLERQGFVFVRGYREADRETPFTKGFLITWVDASMGRDAGIRKALEVTSARLVGEEDANPFMVRIRLLRDSIVVASERKDLVSKDFLRRKIGCTQYELDTTITRAKELYADIVEVKLFGAYPHYHLTSLAGVDLAAAVQLKESYIRKVKGSANRQGHNFESAASWFVEKTTQGARFWKQNHRERGMHCRRITTHLTKAVGDRRSNAEVDRVWEVTPGPLQPPITFVLECKSSIVTKRNLDEFLNILRFSTDFGVDTPEGRAIRNGVVGVFAAGSFNPSEKIRLRNGEVITLSQYAARSNLQLIRIADLNEKLRQRGCVKSITVQRICRLCRDEEEVIDTLEHVWDNASDAENVLQRLAAKNASVFELEAKLKENTPKQLDNLASDTPSAILPSQQNTYP